MTAKLYGPREEVLVDDDVQKDHLANLTRAVLMLLVQFDGALEANMRGAPSHVRAHLQEQSEAVQQVCSHLMAGAIALGFADEPNLESQDGIPT